MTETVLFTKDHLEDMGEKLKQSRQKLGWSLTDMTDKLGGIASRSALWNYEKGINPIPVDRLVPICEAYRISVVELLSLSTSPAPAAYSDLIRDPEFVSFTKALLLYEPDRRKKLLAHFSALIARD